MIKFSKSVIKIILGGAVPVLFSIHVLAAPIEVNLSSDGVRETVQVPANYSEDSISFWTRSSGNMSELGTVTVYGPAGLSVTAKASLVAKSGRLSLSSGKRWYALPFLVDGSERSSFRTSSNGAVFSRTTSALTDSSTPGGVDPCATFTPQTYDYLREYFRLAYGQILTNQQICDLYGGGGTGEPGPGVGTPDPNGGGASGNNGGISNSSGSVFAYGKVIVRKDTCGQRDKAQYLVRIDVKLSRVAAEKRAQGYPVSVGIRLWDYSGERASSIKPTSDGKYAPQPLLLMTSVGGAQRLNVVRWANSGKISSVRTKKPADYVYWRGHVLTRTPAGSLLTGGKATVELTNDGRMYSVCFNMVRSRQSLHGYGK